MRTIYTLFLIPAFFGAMSFFLPDAHGTRACFSYNLHIALDTLPPQFHKHIEVKGDTVWFGASEKTLDGGLLIVGNTGEYDFNREALVIKTDARGNVEWARSVGDDLPYVPVPGPVPVDIDEYFRDVALMPDSGFVAMCPRRSSLTHPQVKSPFLARFDRHGNLLWAKDLGVAGVSPSQTYLYRIAATGDGGILCTGTLPGKRAFAARFSPDGDFLGGRIFGGAGADLVLSHIEVLPTGVLAIGATLYSGPRRHALLRLSPGLNILAAKRYTYGATMGDGFGIAWANLGLADGHLLGTGIQSEDFPFPFRKAAILRVDSLGNLLWAKSYGDGTLHITDFVEDIRPAPDGQAWVSFADAYQFSANANASGQWDNQHESPNLAIVDSLGNLLWNANYGDYESQQVKGSLTLMPGGLPLVCSEAQRFFGIGIDVLGLDTAGAAGCVDRPLGIAVEEIPEGRRCIDAIMGSRPCLF